MAAGLLALTLLGVWLGPRLTSPPPWTSAGQESVENLREGQLENARVIMAVGRDLGAEDAAIRVALMTAMQESSLRNLHYGDRDSLGLFQQRPSQGWGTPEQIVDPVFATKSFFGHNPAVDNPGLAQIENWQSMSPTDAAQAVQRSAYPQAYARWEKLARDIMATERDAPPVT